jgi:dihydrofolate reductase
MRQVVLQLHVTLDGCSHEEGDEIFRWLMDTPDDEHDEHYVAGLRGAGTHIMGRATYLEMEQYWPVKAAELTGAEAEIAAIMNKVPKVVFSKSLTAGDWAETRVASGDTAAEIARLKAEPGGEIIAHGGTEFVRSLIGLGLVDEYRLYVLPVAAGREGQPLFNGLPGPQILRLVSATAFPSGQLAQVYRPTSPGRAEG